MNPVSRNSWFWHDIQDEPNQSEDRRPGAIKFVARCLKQGMTRWKACRLSSGVFVVVESRLRGGASKLNADFNRFRSYSASHQTIHVGSEIYRNNRK